MNLNKTQSNAANAEKQTGPRKFTKVFPAPDSSVKLQKPAPLSDSQQAKYDEVLQHFKSTEEYPTALKAGSPKKPLTEWEKLRLLSRESMLRYLRASKWDVATAKKRLTETIAWRREYGVDSLKAEDLEEEAKTGKETVLGFDNKGRPLHYMHPSRNTTEETPRQMQYAVWILERAIDVMPPGVEMLALLINFGGKKRNPTSISNAKLMLYILQNHYVERLGIALCINVPWIFKAFWSAIQPFIDPVTKGKCKFDEAIKDEVPNAQLASDFGGLLDFPYEHDKYWPQLLELTKKRREEQLERFRTVCNSEIGASEWDMRGGEDFDRNPFAPQKQDSGFHELRRLRRLIRLRRARRLALLLLALLLVHRTARVPARPLRPPLPTSRARCTKPLQEPKKTTINSTASTPRNRNFHLLSKAKLPTARITDGRTRRLSTTSRSPRRITVKTELPLQPRRLLRRTRTSMAMRACLPPSLAVFQPDCSAVMLLPVRARKRMRVLIMNRSCTISITISITIRRWRVGKASRYPGRHLLFRSVESPTVSPQNRIRQMIHSNAWIPLRPPTHTYIYTLLHLPLSHPLPRFAFLFV